jgi:hypothetical protein
MSSATFQTNIFSVETLAAVTRLVVPEDSKIYVALHAIKHLVQQQGFVNSLLNTVADRKYEIVIDQTLSPAGDLFVVAFRNVPLIVLHPNETFSYNVQNICSVHSQIAESRSGWLSSFFSKCSIQ